MNNKINKQENNMENKKNMPKKPSEWEMNGPEEKKYQEWRKNKLESSSKYV